jgi:hypothetical protein
VTPYDDGAGVAWLIERLLEDPEGFAALARQHAGVDLT